MTAKEYLGQAYRLDQRINSKLEQVLSLRGLTTKATATMSDMPGGGSRNVYKMQDRQIRLAGLKYLPLKKWTGLHLCLLQPCILPQFLLH